MKKFTYMRTLLAVVAMAAIGFLAQPVFAQRGGGHGRGNRGFAWFCNQEVPKTEHSQPARVTGNLGTGH